MLEILKNGSGIHIKEKNKGSFTRWCGGNVTSECIQRGKNSSNPKIRKKATFADNARHFKHRLGGNIEKLQQGNKVSWWSKVGNFINSDTGKALISTGTSLLKTNAENKQLEAEADAQKAQNEYDWEETMRQIQAQNQQEANQMYQQWAQAYQSGSTTDQPSDIVAKHLGYKRYSQNLTSQQYNLKNQNAAIDAQVKSQKAAQNANFWSSTLQQGLGMVGNYLSNKKSLT